eukprot:PhM_4_TR15876/c0_g2_i1/m.84803
MPIDRLTELQEFVDGRSPNEPIDQDLAPGQRCAQEARHHLEDVTRSIDAVRRDLAQFESTIVGLDDGGRAEMERRMDENVAAAEHSAKAVTKVLNEMGALVTKPVALNEAELRALQTARGFYAKKLVDAASSLWQTREAYAKVRNNSLRSAMQAEFVVRAGRVVPEEVLDAALEITLSNPDHQLPLQQQQQQQRRTRDTLRESLPTLNEAQIMLEIALETQRDVRKIEQELQELWQLFSDAQLLLSEQGEALTDILTQCQTANEEVHVGVENMTKAVEQHKKIRRKQNCLLIFIVCALGAIIIGVGFPLMVLYL